MKRREALKNIGLSAGAVLATPSLFSILQSCTSDVATWTPDFLTSDQGVVLKGIIDVILPKTDTPSGNEVNVAQFIDKYANEVISTEDQAKQKAAYENLVSLIKRDYNENLSKVTTNNYMALLDTHMKSSSEDQPESDPDKTNASQLLNSIKGMSIWAYRVSETVGETVLAYDPIPGAAYCGDLQELTGGKAWSL